MENKTDVDFNSKKFKYDVSDLFNSSSILFNELAIISSSAMFKCEEIILSLSNTKLQSTI